METRREKLEAMLAADPQDKFLRYALAMEMDNAGQHAKSLELFQSLIDDDPPYVPAYFMAGQQLAKIGQVSEARKILEAGIEVARTQHELHAAGEMSEFLASLVG
jgi:tetratricopeptide (TPR) repeat protein